MIIGGDLDHPKYQDQLTCRSFHEIKSVFFYSSDNDLFAGDDYHRESSAARQEHDRRRHRQERRRRRHELIIRSMATRSASSSNVQRPSVTQQGSQRTLPTIVHHKIKNCIRYIA